MGSKTWRFQVEHLPYAVLIGDQELESGLFSVRSRIGELSEVSQPSFIDKILKDIALKR